MMPILFSMPGNAVFAAQLSACLPCEQGSLEIHRFPDGESCPRFLTPVAGRDVVFACALDAPDDKILPAYLAASVARELGARSVGLVVPYLPYMRQDARFREGEGITSVHFARLLSACCDWLVTVDPHLHRHAHLSAIYSNATRVVQAAPAISGWIAANVERSVVVGPDAESEQWVAQVAAAAGCPFTVLAKKRSGDHAVEVSMPDTASWAGMTPVLVDDIISTARTMVAAARQIIASGMAPPVCIGVHALFAGDALDALQAAGVQRIVTCNTVPHASNGIDLSTLIAAAVNNFLRDFTKS
jgi:ribose-phosphate pyrophosphokinase